MSLSLLNKKGFSLLEIILALTVSLIVAGVVLPVWPRIAEQKILLADKKILSELSSNAYSNYCKDSDRLAVSDDGLATTNLTDLPRPGESAPIVVRIESSACPNNYCIDGALKTYVSYMSGTVVDPNYGVVDTRKHPIVYISASGNYHSLYIDDGSNTYEVSAVFLSPGLDNTYDSTVEVSVDGSGFDITVHLSNKDLYATSSLKAEYNDWAETYEKLSAASSAYSVAVDAGCDLSSSCSSSTDNTQDCIKGILSNCPSALNKLSDSYDAWGSLLYWDNDNTEFFSAGPGAVVSDSDDITQGYIKFDYCENVIL